MILTLLLACKDEPPADDSEPTTCDSNAGTARGTVVDQTGNPIANADILAVEAPGGGTPLTTPADGDGAWELSLTTGDWILYARTPDGSCTSNDAPLTVEACADEEVVLTIDLGQCDIADKPNLYLYPESTTPMRVDIGLQRGQSLVAVDPPLPWRGVAHPDGRWSVGRATYDYLFYEVSLRPAQAARLQRQAGWCVQGVPEMLRILDAYGFWANEVADFEEAWTLDLPAARGYTVYPQRDVDEFAALTLDLPVDRLWLLVEEGCTARHPPQVDPLDREGPHGVEWGVVLHGIGR